MVVRQRSSLTRSRCSTTGWTLTSNAWPVVRPSSEPIGVWPIALSPTIGAIALVAFPAMIVGGMDSPIGAVFGGLIIGLTQALTAGYQEDIAPWLGQNFGAVMPYVVMIVILLVRPYGLFGTAEVRRV